MRFRLWRRQAAPREPPGHDFGKEQPLVSAREKPQEPKAQQRIAPIAKDKRGEIAAFVNYVDIGIRDYDYLFSDFDPSSYSSRILSKDLIDEVMRRHRETREGEIEVRFAVPAHVRNRDDEGVIRSRLKEYFQAQSEKIGEQIREWQGEIRQTKKGGVVMMLVGLALVTLHRFLSDALGGGMGHEIYKWFENPMELFGWIATWVGADRAFLHKSRGLKELMEEKATFDRFARANFVFVSAESVKKGIEKAGERPERKEKEGKPAKSAETAQAAPNVPAPGPQPASDARGGGTPE